MTKDHKPIPLPVALERSNSGNVVIMKGKAVLACVGDIKTQNITF